MSGGKIMKRREERMYEFVSRFLKEEKKCERILINEISFRALKRWKVDVAGIRRPYLYGVEVKAGFSFDHITSALKQAEFMCKAFTHVYICFPKDEYEREDNEELRKYLEKELERLGIGVLTLNGSHVDEKREPDLERIKGYIDFEEYYRVLTYFEGRLEQEQKKWLVKCAGLWWILYCFDKKLDDLEKYKQKVDERKAIQFLLWDLLWPLPTSLRGNKRRTAEVILRKIKEEALNKGVGVLDFLSSINDLENYLINKIGPEIKEVRNIIECLKLFKKYDGNILELYKEEGADSFYKALQGINGIGSKTATLLMNEFTIYFGMEPPSEAKLTEEAEDALKGIGLRIEDFSFEQRPIIESFGWFMRGGLRSKEISENLEKLFKVWKRKADKLREYLRSSFM